MVIPDRVGHKLESNATIYYWIKCQYVLDKIIDNKTNKSVKPSHTLKILNCFKMSIFQIVRLDEKCCHKIDDFAPNLHYVGTTILNVVSSIFEVISVKYY